MQKQSKFSSKAILALFFIGLSSPVLAKDFRTLDFGDECREVTALEASLGTTVGSADEASGWYSFRGWYEQWPVGIVYLCEGGKFLRGTYQFDNTTFAEAAQVYGQVKRSLSRSLGSPTYDCLPGTPPEDASDWARSTTQ